MKNMSIHQFVIHSCSCKFRTLCLSLEELSLRDLTVVSAVLLKAFDAATKHLHVAAQILSLTNNPGPQYSISSKCITVGRSRAAESSGSRTHGASQKEIDCFELHLHLLSDEGMPFYLSIPFFLPTFRMSRLAELQPSTKHF